MSSETILFDATWGRRTSSLGRSGVAPTESTMPVFPTYEPSNPSSTPWLRCASTRRCPYLPCTGPESDPDALGAPFFVMERISGDVPPDVMPYNFGSWVTEASPEQRKTPPAQLGRRPGSIACHRQALCAFRLPPTPQFGNDCTRSIHGTHRRAARVLRVGGLRRHQITTHRTCPRLDRGEQSADDSPAVLCWGRLAHRVTSCTRTSRR